MRPANVYQADFTTPRIVPAPAGRCAAPRICSPAPRKSTCSTTIPSALGTADRAGDRLGLVRLFMKPIFSLLMWLFCQIGNFGVAIIFLTIIVRLILFPLAQKQFASMAKMRVVQPKVKVLQERYKDDKPRLQQEMMKLYKEEKVNPVAGCLPIFLQIPIFYALYKVLMVAVEMRHKPFALWIHDLSAPDPLTPVNLFGYSLSRRRLSSPSASCRSWSASPCGCRCKMNPQPTDPMQRQIFALMPWVLMFVMAPFAAGLQLYWVTNNISLDRPAEVLYAGHPALKRRPRRRPPPPPPPPSPPAPGEAQTRRR